MLTDRRIFQRFAIIFAIEFKRPDEEGKYYLGITKNYSYDGFCIETQCLSFEQGENLEVKLKHPRRDMSVTMPGEVAWKKTSDKFACSMGIILSELDLENKMNILEIMSSAGGIPVDSFLMEEQGGNGKEQEGLEGQNIQLNTEQEDGFMPERLSRDIEHIELENKEEIVSEEQEPGRPIADESSFQAHAETGETGYAVDDETSELRVNEHEVNAFQIELDKTGDDNASDTGDKRRDNRGKYILIAIVIAAALAYAVPLLFKQFNSGSKSPVPVSKKSADQQEKNNELIILSTDKDRANEFPLKRLKQSGELPTLKDTGSNKIEQDVVTDIQKPIVGAKTKGSKEYYIQVGAWRNEVYAKAMLAKLKKHYPDARIIVENNYHKVRIPGIVSKTRGKEILKDIAAKFNTRALLTVNK